MQGGWNTEMYGHSGGFGRSIGQWIGKINNGWVMWKEGVLEKGWWMDGGLKDKWINDGSMN